MPEYFKVKRGEIYDVDWGGASGKHPALIIQNDTGNMYSDTTIVAYISHTKKDYPIIVNFEDRESSLPHGGGINLGRIMTIPKSMLGEKKGILSISKIAQVNEAIKVSLGIE
jgi:mRNA interferase MazF